MDTVGWERQELQRENNKLEKKGAPFVLPPDANRLARPCFAHTMHINRMISCNRPWTVSASGPPPSLSNAEKSERNGKEKTRWIEIITVSVSAFLRRRATRTKHFPGVAEVIQYSSSSSLSVRCTGAISCRRAMERNLSVAIVTEWRVI